MNKSEEIIRTNPAPIDKTIQQRGDTSHLKSPQTTADITSRKEENNE